MASPAVGASTRWMLPRTTRETVRSTTLASGLLHADVEPFSPTGSPPPKMTERHARMY